VKDGQLGFWILRRVCVTGIRFFWIDQIRLRSFEVEPLVSALTTRFLERVSFIPLLRMYSAHSDGTSSASIPVVLFLTSAMLSRYIHRTKSRKSSRSHLDSVNLLFSTVVNGVLRVSWENCDE
jgi:hypothetical protein